MRFLIGATAMLSLVACGSQIPDSAAGIPTTNSGAQLTYGQQQAARDAELQQLAIPPAGAISDEVSGLRSTPAPNALATTTPAQSTATRTAAMGQPLNATGTQTATAPAGAFGTTSAGVNTGDALARDTAAALAQTSQNSNQAQALQLSNPTNTSLRTVTTTDGISNENNFDAVGSARSIDADAQLIAQNRAQYQVVQPTALPSRSGTSEPNVVQYALSTNHAVGATLYSRSGINKKAKAQRACAKYGSADLAQADFLAKGGPRRDRLGLDPDGDGFACSWDPRPFRAAVGG